MITYHAELGTAMAVVVCMARLTVTLALLVCLQGLNCMAKQALDARGNMQLIDSGHASLIIAFDNL